MASVEPLIQERSIPVANVIEPAPITQDKGEHYSFDSVYSEEFEPKTIGNEEAISFQRGGVQDRLFNQLRQGQLRLDAELDLHGMTIAIAHQQLAEFIDECRRQNIRCVRIIHGKGWGSKDNKPVLKTKLNAWLQHEENVLAFCSAPIKDGGTGAVFVLLRRNKNSSSLQSI
ncbi:MAG: DNA mismatch repair protein MutS [Methylophaga sp.]|nr:DNA mismatch repair protein MutS [Methylophaga sp.]